MGGRLVSEGLLGLSFCCYFVNSKREQSGEEGGRKEEGEGGGGSGCLSLYK
jgi:hypothetical protein